MEFTWNKIQIYFDLLSTELYGKIVFYRRVCHISLWRGSYFHEDPALVSVYSIKHNVRSKDEAIKFGLQFFSMVSSREVLLYVTLGNKNASETLIQERLKHLDLYEINPSCKPIRFNMTGKIKVDEFITLPTETPYYIEEEGKLTPVWVVRPKLHKCLLVAYLCKLGLLSIDSLEPGLVSFLFEEREFFKETVQVEVCTLSSKDFEVLKLLDCLTLDKLRDAIK